MYLPRPQFQSTRPPRVRQVPYGAGLQYRQFSEDSSDSFEESRRGKQRCVEPKFHLFSFLPKELRLKIWQHSLPSPKLLELNLFKYTSEPGARSWETHPSKFRGRKDALDWRWECTCSTPQPQHMFTCKESLSVFRDRYIFLNIFPRNPKTLGQKRVYCDYARDIIYVSKRNWELLVDSSQGRFPAVKELPVDLSRVRNLAVSSLLPHTWPRHKFYGVQQFHNPGGWELAFKVLAPIFSLFPKLASFRLTIDGRRRGPEAPHVIVDATEEYFDYYQEDGRDDYVEWVTRIGEELRMKHPRLRIPSFGLGLLMDEEPVQDFERRWDYACVTCRFCIPDSTDHREVSRSPTIGMRFFHGDTSSGSWFESSDSSDSSDDEGREYVPPPIEYDSDGDPVPSRSTLFCRSVPEYSDSSDDNPAGD